MSTTITKDEAVRAFADGKRVECIALGEWKPVHLFGTFDFDTQFRLAPVDDDAEWLRGIGCEVSLERMFGAFNVKSKLSAIAARLEADKARISYLEATHGTLADVANPNGSTCARLKYWKDKADEDADRIAELEAEPAKHAEPAWIPHDGGPMPCDGELLVELQFPDGTTAEHQAKFCEWQLERGDDEEIVFWRPAKGGSK